MEVYRLANIKSAKKRIVVAETRAARNKAIRSKVKTFVKKVEAAITAGDKAAAQAALLAATSEIDKATSKGINKRTAVSEGVSETAVLFYISAPINVPSRFGDSCSIFLIGSSSSTDQCTQFHPTPSAGLASDPGA